MGFDSGYDTKLVMVVCLNGRSPVAVGKLSHDAAACNIAVRLERQQNNAVNEVPEHLSDLPTW
jgi:hypothetical protein